MSIKHIHIVVLCLLKILTTHDELSVIYSCATRTVNQLSGACVSVCRWKVGPVNVCDFAVIKSNNCT